MKEIPGFSGYYASQDGHIYSIRTGEMKELSQRIHKGYLHVFVKKGIGRDTKVKMPVHQLMLLTYKGEKETPDLMCRHLDGDAMNNSINNLKWGTAKENVMDSIKHGTAVCLRLGEQHPRTQMKESQVLLIKKLIQLGLSNKEIGTHIGISTSTVATHIQHIFEKMGVSSRAKLVSGLC